MRLIVHMYRPRTGWDMDTVRQDLASDALDKGAFWLSRTWAPEIREAFSQLDNAYLAKLMHEQIYGTSIASRINRDRIPESYYPLTHKIRTFNFEQQAMIFNIKPPNWLAWRHDRDTYPNPANLLNKGELGIIRMLHILQIKEKDFLHRKETSAESAVKILHNQLNTAFDEYLVTVKNASMAFSQKMPNQNNHTAAYSYEETMRMLDVHKTDLEYYEEQCRGAAKKFSDKWQDAIDIAKPELIKHRGMKNVFANLALLIPTLGLLVIYTACVSGGENFLFPLLTSDAAQVLQHLEKSMQDAELSIIADPEAIHMMPPGKG